MVGGRPMLVRAGLAKTKGEARRLIRGGGAKLNDARVDDELTQVGDGELRPDGTFKLSAGKKRHVLLRAG